VCETEGEELGWLFDWLHRQLSTKKRQFWRLAPAGLRAGSTGLFSVDFMQTSPPVDVTAWA
jgi:hypothetical protein